MLLILFLKLSIPFDLINHLNYLFTFDILGQIWHLKNVWNTISFPNNVKVFFVDIKQEREREEWKVIKTKLCLIEWLIVDKRE